MYTDALNATFVTFNGNEGLLQNDMGNAQIYYTENNERKPISLSPGFMPIGIKEHGGVLYIASVNKDGVGELGSIPSPAITYSQISETLNSSTTVNGKGAEVNFVSALDNANYFDLLFSKFLLSDQKYSVGHTFIPTFNFSNMVVSSINSNYGKWLRTMFTHYEDGDLILGVYTLSLKSLTTLGQEEELSVDYLYHYELDGKDCAFWFKIDGLTEKKPIDNPGYQVYPNVPSGKLALQARMNLPESEDYEGLKAIPIPADPDHLQQLSIDFKQNEDSNKKVKISRFTLRNLRINNKPVGSFNSDITNIIPNGQTLEFKQGSIIQFTLNVYGVIEECTDIHNSINHEFYIGVYEFEYNPDNVAYSFSVSEDSYRTLTYDSTLNYQKNEEDLIKDLLQENIYTEDENYYQMAPVVIENGRRTYADSTYSDNYIDGPTTSSLVPWSFSQFPTYLSTKIWIPGIFSTVSSKSDNDFITDYSSNSSESILVKDDLNYKSGTFLKKRNITNNDADDFYPKFWGGNIVGTHKFNKVYDQNIINLYQTGRLKKSKFIINNLRTFQGIKIPNNSTLSYGEGKNIWDLDELRKLFKMQTHSSVLFPGWLSRDSSDVLTTSGGDWAWDFSTAAMFAQLAAVNSDYSFLLFGNYFSRYTTRQTGDINKYDNNKYRQSDLMFTDYGNEYPLSKFIYSDCGSKDNQEIFTIYTKIPDYEIYYLQQNFVPFTYLRSIPKVNITYCYITVCDMYFAENGKESIFTKPAPCRILIPHDKGIYTGTFDTVKNKEWQIDIVKETNIHDEKFSPNTNKLNLRFYDGSIFENVKTNKKLNYLMWSGITIYVDDIGMTIDDFGLLTTSAYSNVLLTSLEKNQLYFNGREFTSNRLQGVSEVQYLYPNTNNLTFTPETGSVKPLKEEDQKLYNIGNDAYSLYSKDYIKGDFIGTIDPGTYIFVINGMTQTNGRKVNNSFYFQEEKDENKHEYQHPFIYTFDKKTQVKIYGNGVVLNILYVKVIDDNVKDLSEGELLSAFKCCLSLKETGQKAGMKTYNRRYLTHDYVTVGWYILNNDRSFKTFNLNSYKSSNGEIPNSSTEEGIKNLLNSLQL